MAKTYQVTFLIRLSNLMASTLVRLGLPIGLIHLLTVRGRKSGELRTIPIAVIKQQGKRYLIAPFGTVNWVRNLRSAAGEATLTRSRHTETIRAVELPPEGAALVLRESVRGGGVPGFVRNYLSVNANSSLEEFEREVLTHPVFLLQSAI
ncbi:MAG TPA: nitroreductase/quinone reductase family protein [Ktedonobacteraceae bacterium]|nr:nitroreductase/quinone reductase family protein [Ktedonobacteraceae bacterium]